MDPDAIAARCLSFGYGVEFTSMDSKRQETLDFQMFCSVGELYRSSESTSEVLTIKTDFLSSG
jgi:hypothetical protein